MKQHSTQKGQAAEQHAAEFLQQKGYTIISRNFRSGKGEIDIIALDNGVVVFVEVKSRQSNYFGFPEAAVTPHKEAMIQQTAELFLEEKQLMLPIRFDIVSITPQEIVHFEDAF